MFVLIYLVQIKRGQHYSISPSTRLTVELPIMVMRSFILRRGAFDALTLKVRNTQFIPTYGAAVSSRIRKHRPSSIILVGDVDPGSVTPSGRKFSRCGENRRAFKYIALNK